MADGRDDDAAVNERIRIAVDERIRNTVNERLREDADFLQMHGIENAGMTIVTAPMDGTNYLAWSRAIKLALRGRMKLCFIDGTSLKPDHGHENYDKWIRVDSMVQTWILNSISKNIVGAFLYTKTSRELWLDLEERYGESNGPLVYQLQREITSISQGSLSVVEYFTKLKILWDELACLVPTQGCTCGFCICDYGKIAAESNTLNQLMQFLMGLNDTYDHIRSQILVMEPLPSVNKAYSMVQRVEKQRKLNLLTNEIPEGVALNARWSGPRGRDQKQENFRKRDIMDKKSQFCSHCDKSGHTRETCFKLHGYPEWYKTMQEQKKRDGRNFNAHMTQDKVIETKPGFNAHMTQDKMTETKSGQGNVNSADISEAVRQELLKLIKGKGPQDPLQINFAHALDDFAGTGYDLNYLDANDSNFWIVDTGATSHMLCQSSHIRFIFLSTHCLIQDLRSKAIIGVGRQWGSLYVLDKTSFNSTFIHQHTENQVPSELCNLSALDKTALWHRRFGHPSHIVLKHIMSLPHFDSMKHCSVCPLAKQQRLPFSTCQIQSTSIFELVHLDLWGPYKLPSLTNCSYFLTVVDDYSRATWTFLLQHKFQVYSKLEKFFNTIKTQYDAIVKIVRTDNGSEFVNSSCNTLFQSLGITHQRTSPYSPQQNGVVERKHKHLLAVARALLFEGSLPRRFWGECILTATYLINRLPSSLLQWKSPFEILHNKSPSFDHLRVFGCLCYATNVQPHKDKFAHRADKCIFLGYCQLQKAYRLYNLQSHSLLTSRDVIFHEHIFPYKDNPPIYTHTPLPAPIPDTVISDSQTHSTPVYEPSAPSSPVNPPPSVPTSSTHSLPPAPRRTQRHVTPPAWLRDYICNHSSHSTNTCTPSMFTPAHRSFIANVAAIQEPRSFAQACQDERWNAAMQYELDALERNQTWDLCDLPANKKAIGSRWVYKVKLLPDGSVDRYKARLCQRVFLAIASSYSWPISQLDVNNAFLHGHLEEEVYMLPPEGYLRARPGQVCRLKRSLYGLKQASRQWNIELTSKLESHGFTRSPHDHCFFTKGNGPSFLALLVYVDDILITGPSLSYIQEIKTYLNRLFTIKDLGFAKYFLGLELSRSPHGTYVNQAKYLHDILVDCKMLDARATATPLPPGIKFDNSTGALLSSPDRYRRIVGRLLYLGFSRPDISFAVQQLSQFLQHPRVPHWDAAIYLLRYLKGTPNLGLFFPANTSLQLCAYSDSDWASCPDSRRSLTGYCVFLGGALISWKTKKQATVSRSSTEAEYRSMASTVCELLWIHYLLHEFRISPLLPIPFWCDNKAAIHIAENPVFMSGPSISTSIAIWSANNLSKDLLLRNTSPAKIKSRTFSPNLSQLPLSPLFLPSWVCILLLHLEGGL
ncbi:UNVERIFIED_CONTAM: Retrovirus-related Pol polyprotein from transposon RE1 [Sesamum radiatum]|uniref:Retrovirus-related Pol polyprotein from transposon RE1 n=1 Tax=Sesamum radiatum TaxID=300843 RepID=A0AAW2SJP7_SESRA